jgi:predicted GH43/DUF377 family glycosyl hydrolase
VVKNARGFNKIRIKDEGIVLEKTNLSFENIAVLNPACIKIKDTIHMFYRAIGGKGNISSIGYCKLKDHKVIERYDQPVLTAQQDYEKCGLEDPRIVCVDGVYYLYYAVFDGKTALGCYATSTNLPDFTAQGIISARVPFKKAKKIFKLSKSGQKYLDFQKVHMPHLTDKDIIWQKNIFLFPKKINNQFAIINRTVPGIHVFYADKLEGIKNKHWKKYFKVLDKYVLLHPEFEFENHHISGGCPPIETKDGWLFIYHSMEQYKDKAKTSVFHACAALLDLKDPTKVIAKLKYPLFSPENFFEKIGVANNVVFPTSTIIEDGRLYIYYGAADKCIAVKSLELQELIDALKS